MIRKEVGHIRFEKNGSLIKKNILILIHGPTTNVMWTCLADITYERDKIRTHTSMMALHWLD